MDQSTTQHNKDNNLILKNIDMFKIDINIQEELIVIADDTKWLPFVNS